eukprot:271881_1
MKNHNFRVDHFARKAKTQGYLTRAVYKLIEVDKKYKLFQPGNSCLDLGCSPGSWMQYVIKRVGKKGFVVGIDLNDINIQHIKDNILESVQHKDDIAFPNIHHIKNDIFKWDYVSEFKQLKHKNLENSKQNPDIKHNFYNLNCIEYGFDHIISDIAPNISGIKSIDNDNSYDLWIQSLTLSRMLGGINSNLIIKVFQSEKMKEFVSEMRQYYKSVKTFKPDASRDTSNEMYIIGKQLKNKTPYFDLKPAKLDIEDLSVQQMFNLWDYLHQQQHKENNDYISDLINDRKPKITPKVNVSKSELLSKLS